MKGQEFNKLFNNTIETAKNSLISILIKLFNENHNNDYEIVFKEDIYYNIPNGYCFPKRMWLDTNHKLVIERIFNWEDFTIEEEKTCLNDMSLKDLIDFCQFITEDFENYIK